VWAIMTIRAHRPTWPATGVRAAGAATNLAEAAATHWPASGDW
jgi:hypothetical protein